MRGMTINIYEQIQRLVNFGISKKLIQPSDEIFIRNSLLESLGLDEFVTVNVVQEEVDSPVEILEYILNWAAKNGKLEQDTVTYRDLLDTKLMGHFLSKPSETIAQFYSLYEKNSPNEATSYLYNLSKDTNYIRTDRIAKNEHWYSPTDYGDIEITINLSKPEKDPKAIEASKNMKSSSYPDCLLCKENVGYAGRLNHPARQNLRVIPFEIGNETWNIQFSPYVYYNEHAIVFLDKHEPMKISKRTFDRLLEFVEKFPHYFVGSNADLPIVGGSILSHDHYQGGFHEFPMAKAEIETEFEFSSFPNVKAGIVKWPMSIIRLQGLNRVDLSNLAELILQSWKGYSDPQVDILAFTDATPHNTITPIARRRGELFEIDLVLRNNRTNEQHPLGIFHPHQEVHHIKKENIGLIEVMGLAVLPGRLKEELKLLEAALIKDQFLDEIIANESIVKHLEWAIHIKETYPTIDKTNCERILKQEIGIIFSTILEHAGVYKRNSEGKQGFLRFLNSI
jgi:UDPglucose--hexose-1-phosphate uridylyltransferase